MIRHAAILLLATLAIGTLGRPAYAAEANAAAPALAAAGEFAVPALGAARARTLTLTVAEPAPFAKRPAALPALYISLAITEALDAYTTRQGLSAGAREANPLMQGGSAGLWTLKAVGTVVPIVLAERMWKKNKAGAIVTMVLANSVMATVAANNARVVNRLQ